AVRAAAGLNAVQNLQQRARQLFVPLSFKTLGKFLQFFTTGAEIGHAFGRPLAARQLTPQINNLPDLIQYPGRKVLFQTFGSTEHFGLRHYYYFCKPDGLSIAAFVNRSTALWFQPVKFAYA